MTHCSHTITTQEQTWSKEEDLVIAFDHLPPFIQDEEDLSSPRPMVDTLQEPTLVEENHEDCGAMGGLSSTPISIFLDLQESCRSTQISPTFF